MSSKKTNKFIKNKIAVLKKKGVDSDVLAMISANFHNKVKAAQENNISLTNKSLEAIYKLSENMVDIQNIMDIDLHY